MARAREQTEDWRQTAGRLAGLFADAPKMPLMRDRVRVDKRDADALAGTVDASVRAVVDRGALTQAAGYQVLAVTSQMREVLRNAYPVPLTDQVRVPRTTATDLATALRNATQT